jgi:hypothetical protein
MSAALEPRDRPHEDGGSGGVNVTVALVVAILSVAVVGSVVASALAIHGADAELPEQYHWEGAQYDRDVALAERAMARAVAASVEVDGATCRVQLTMAGALPAALTLSFVHGTDPRLDRFVPLAPGPQGYEGHCAGLTAAHYHLELSDEPQTWSIRQEIRNAGGRIELRAHRLGG